MADAYGLVFHNLNLRTHMAARSYSAWLASEAAFVQSGCPSGTPVRAVRHSSGRFSAGLLSLWLFALCTGCGPAPITAKDALNAARLFVDALALLDAASKLYRASVSSAVHTTKEEIRASGAAPADTIILPKLATVWEERWTAVIKQTGALEEQFAAVEASSARYWAILEQVTGEIKDQTTRDAEIAKNKQARVKWDEAHEAAKKHLETARTLRDKGSDIGKTMLAAALRGQLAEYTSKLDSIASEAEQLLAALEAITEEGRKIVGSVQ